jgi:hypothetical protein
LITVRRRWRRCSCSRRACFRRSANDASHRACTPFRSAPTASQAANLPGATTRVATKQQQGLLVDAELLPLLRCAAIAASGIAKVAVSSGRGGGVDDDDGGAATAHELATLLLDLGAFVALAASLRDAVTGRPLLPREPTTRSAVDVSLVAAVCGSLSATLMSQCCSGGDLPTRDVLQLMSQSVDVVELVASWSAEYEQCAFDRVRPHFVASLCDLSAASSSTLSSLLLGHAPAADSELTVEALIRVLAAAGSDPSAQPAASAWLVRLFSLVQQAVSSQRVPMTALAGLVTVTSRWMTSTATRESLELVSCVEALYVAVQFALWHVSDDASVRIANDAVHAVTSLADRALDAASTTTTLSQRASVKQSTCYGPTSGESGAPYVHVEEKPLQRAHCVFW